MEVTTRCRHARPAAITTGLVEILSDAQALS